MSGPLSAGAAFRLDRDRAPQAITELEQALSELKLIKTDAEQLANVRPPSRDAVSRDAAALLGARAVGGPGSLVSALQAGIDQLEEHIRNLRIALDEYAQGDESTAASFPP